MRSLTLEGHDECVLDVSYELVVCIGKLYELITTRSLERKWTVLLHHLILVAAHNIVVSSDPHRCEMVLALANRISQSASSALFAQGSVQESSMPKEELVSLNVDLLLLLLNASDRSDETRAMAFKLGSYDIANKISLLSSCLSDLTTHAGLFAARCLPPQADCSVQGRICLCADDACAFRVQDARGWNLHAHPRAVPSYQQLCRCSFLESWRADTIAVDRGLQPHVCGCGGKTAYPFRSLLSKRAAGKPVVFKGFI